MNRVIHFLCALSLVVWLGGMIFFGFVVAPSAFESLPTRQLAGTIVGATLSKLNFISIAVLASFIAFTLISFGLQKQGIKKRQWMMIVLALGALVICLYSWFGIDRPLHGLRAHLDALASSSQGAALQVQFDRLHRQSVILFSVNIGLGLVILGLWDQDH